MLIILPPSESKRPAPARGKALGLDELSFPQLNPMRELVMSALIETSGAPDALERLMVRPSLIEEVLGNTDLHETPTQRAAELYTGALHAGFDWPSLSPAARRRAGTNVVITSALWGALRPTDRIPTYRLFVCAHLIGLERLEPTWRTVLPEVLAEAALTSGVVLDLRSPMFQAIGAPVGMSDRTVTMRVLPEAGARSIGNVIGKRVRGQIARYLLELGADPAEPSELVAILSDEWPSRLDPPAGPRRPWTLIVRPRD